MVGNDFVISSPINLKPKVPPEIRQRLFMPKLPAVSHRPNQNFRTLAYNSAPVMSPLAITLTPTIRSSSTFFSRAKIVTIIIVLLLFGLTVGAIREKKQVIRLVNHVQTMANQVSQEVTHHPTVPAVNPQQLIIHTSDYDTALTALMTQTITIHQGSYSQVVNGSVIANWLNINTERSLTYLTVNTQQVIAYLNQVIKANGQTAVLAPSSSIIKNIADNLLTAKGLTITLPTS
jgi:hypothetical protein